MTKRRNSQNYSPAEFDAVVTMLQNNTGLRKDIEAITGQTLDGKTPRELFDLFRALDGVTEIQAVVIRYGHARQAIRQTRAALEGTETAENVLDAARSRILELEKRNEALKAKNAALNARAGATPLQGRVIPGQVAQ